MKSGASPLTLLSPLKQIVGNWRMFMDGGLKKPQPAKVLRIQKYSGWMVKFNKNVHGCIAQKKLFKNVTVELLREITVAIRAH